MLHLPYTDICQRVLEYSQCNGGKTEGTRNVVSEKDFENIVDRTYQQ